MSLESALGITSSLVGIGGNILVSAKNESELKELEKKIQGLSAVQQEELALKQQQAKDEIAKMQVLYQYLALVKNQYAVDKTEIKRKIAFGALAVTLAALILIVVKIRKNE